MRDLTGHRHDAEEAADLGGPGALINLRDLGGLLTDSGGVTRHGVLLRGDAPLAGDQPPGDIRWPPSLVVDLRSDAEIQDAALTWGPGTSVYHLDVHNGATPTVTPDNVDWIGLYRAIMDGAATHIADLMRVVAAASDGPVLVHCTAGKDRTGVVVALLLLAADVSDTSVVTDYMATRVSASAFLRRHPQFRQRGMARDEGDSSRDPADRKLAVSRTAIVDVVRRVRASGTQGWFRERGVDRAHLATWRNRLVASLPVAFVTCCLRHLLPSSRRRWR
jgi:protein-tyrosine phosphatase